MKKIAKFFGNLFFTSSMLFFIWMMFSVVDVWTNQLTNGAYATWNLIEIIF